MYRATTPTHIFTLPFDAGSCSEIQVTYKQNDHTSSASSRSASPGAFYNGSYELMYAY